MKEGTLITICLLFLSATFCNAQEFKIITNVGINTNSVDLYELSAGPLFYKNHFGFSTNIVVNHNKVGFSVPLFLKSKGPMHGCYLVFLRPRYDYYFDEKRDKNYKKYEMSVIGLDLGVGISGSSPLQNIFIGTRHETRTSETSFVIGLGLNL